MKPVSRRLSPFWDLVAFQLALQNSEHEPSYNESRHDARERLAVASGIYTALLQRIAISGQKIYAETFKAVFDEEAQRYETLSRRARINPHLYTGFLEKQQTDKGRLKARVSSDFSMAAVSEGFPPAFKALKESPEFTAALADRSDLQQRLEHAYEGRDRIARDVIPDLRAFDTIVRRMNMEPGFEKLSHEMIAGGHAHFGTPHISAGIFRLLQD